MDISMLFWRLEEVVKTSDKRRKANESTKEAKWMVKREYKKNEEAKEPNQTSSKMQKHEPCSATAPKYSRKK